MLKLPGLIDPHVHMREPGAMYKEDWDTGTSAALAGGVTMVLAMPNTKPPIFDAETLNLALASARSKARCDYAQFLGAGTDNTSWDACPELPPRAAGLKMYLDQTFGQLRLDDMTIWQDHFQHWPKDMPIVAHSENRSMAAVILMASIYNRSVHIAHISLKEEILLIRVAKERGIRVTCEVCPHHLFLNKDDITLPSGENEGGLKGGRGDVRPLLATKEDVESLWQNLDVIDCFASDHAPHTLVEKDGENPPPGFPGLETTLPLLLTAVNRGQLTLEDIILRMYTNPRKIFNLPDQPETWIEVDEDAEYEIHASRMHSRCGWTPFEGWQVKGRLQKVVLRGQEVYRDGKILARTGFGRNIRTRD